MVSSGSLYDHAGALPGSDESAYLAMKEQVKRDMAH